MTSTEKTPNLTADPATGPVPGKWTYAGLFFITLTTLMFEILLTRIFSVTMWYHFAFVAISLAMFGMTVGALSVYLLPRFFKPERVHGQLTWSTLAFSVTALLSFLFHLKVPFILYHDVIAGWKNVVLTYVVIAVPFVFSGIAVTLALTRFPGKVSRLYGADLLGAALGCILLMVVINLTTDASTTVLFVCAFSAMGAFAFALTKSGPILRGFTAVVAAVFLIMAVGHTVLVYQGHPLLFLENSKGKNEPPPLFVEWNSFSRIHVFGNPDEAHAPFGWGISDVLPKDMRVRELEMRIDAEAGTKLTAYSGQKSEILHLKYDVTNIAHYLREQADLLVVGAGGGRDVLSGLVFDQNHIRAVELNPIIIDAVTDEFGEFTGHLDRNPKIEFVCDEARSYIARQKDKFDLIQISLIDTWAATAAGAFVLSENSLYTVEAWNIFLEHLKQNGVLTVSRWYFRERPAEMYRLLALAAQTLKNRGVENPRDHILIARKMHFQHFGVPEDQRGSAEEAPEGVGTILVSVDPFSEGDVARFNRVCSRLRFDRVLTPDFSVDEVFTRLAAAEDLEIFTKNYPLNIEPPTDNSPFFFHMLRLSDIFNREQWQMGQMSFNFKAVAVLGALLLTVTVLSIIFILGPLLLTVRQIHLARSMPWFVYFCGIGLGFMLIEISQMQRLVVFLGHPTYSLSVVLFSLLLSSSLGSFYSKTLLKPEGPDRTLRAWGILIVVLVLFGLITPSLIQAFQTSMTPLRIALAVALLFPLGFCMGIPFPLGMEKAGRQDPAITPWLFGINGAASVCASVLAVALALQFGISLTYGIGVVVYIVAAGAYWLARRQG